MIPRRLGIIRCCCAPRGQRSAAVSDAPEFGSVPSIRGNSCPGGRPQGAPAGSGNLAPAAASAALRPVYGGPTLRGTGAESSSFGICRARVADAHDDERYVLRNFGKIVT